MENASKALLIAGAILIVILLIAVGMMVYNSAKGTVDEGIAQMSSQELQMYNNQFTTYAGNNVNGSNVKALLEKINLNNSNNSDVTAKQVEVTSTVSTNPASTVIQNIFSATKVADVSKIVTSAYYIVKVTDRNNDGLMDTVDVSLKTI